LDLQSQESWFLEVRYLATAVVINRSLGQLSTPEVSGAIQMIVLDAFWSDLEWVVQAVLRNSHSP
jgi:hypothetical protein